MTRQGTSTMHQPLQPPHTTQLSRIPRRRNRKLAIEALDARVVLSGGGLLSSGWSPDMRRFDALGPPAGAAPTQFGLYPSHGDAGGVTELGTQRPPRGGFAGPADFGGDRGPGGYANSAPPLGGLHAPMIIDAWGPGGGSATLVSPWGGWSGMSTRDVVATLLLVDLVGWSNTSTLPASATMGNSLPAASSLSAAAPLITGTSNAAKLLPGSSDPSGARDDRPARDDGLSLSSALTSNAGSGLSFPSQPDARSAPAADLARVTLLPAYSYRGDDASAEQSDALSEGLSGAARLDDEGGLVELSPRGSRSPSSRTLEIEDKLRHPARRLEDFADDVFWDDVLDGLDELLQDSDDEQPLAKARKQPRVERADHGRLDRPAPSPVSPRVLFDEGGLIALEVGGPGRAAMAAPVAALPAFDAVQATIDAEVALFQAFERGEGPLDAPISPASTPPDGDLPAGEHSNARSEESPETAGKVAAGVGLGLLTAWPLARRRKHQREQQR